MPTHALTPAQLRETVDVFRQQDGNVTATARALGLSRPTVQHRLRRAEREGYTLSGGAARAVQEAGLSPGEARAGWIVERDPETGSRKSTYWKKEPLPPEEAADRIKAALSDVPQAPAIVPPERTAADLLTLYPVADLHVGMMAWGEETGEDYDTRTATERLVSWLAQCVDAAPQSASAVILLNGDTLHADDQRNETPRSKHALDVDTRHYRTIEMTVSAVAAATEYAAQRHDRVTVVITPGNHDPHAYLAVLFALAQRYREHDRIDVRQRPGEWWVHQFGRVMLAAHHGDKAKPDRMVHFLADEYAPIWGKTRHRYLWTGHLHHLRAQDIGGVQHEQLRAMTARDAHAVSHAYSARAQLQAVTYHREAGEIQRFKVGM